MAKIARNVEVLYADFAEMKTIENFVDEALAYLGGVDILINNAGMYCRERLMDIPPEKMQQVFQINAVALPYLTQLCAKNMIANKKPGCIINISSIAGTFTIPKGIGYSSSKAAMNKWTKSAALDLAQRYGTCLLTPLA